MASATRQSSSPYIIGPVQDSLWFIFSPLLSLLLGFVLMLKALAWEPRFLDSEPNKLLFYLGIAFTQGHLLATFVRTHGNRSVYRQFRWRFTLVPIVLLAAIYASPWIGALALFVAVFWDVYHSCLQTFGIGRIYDAKAGNGALVGRRLDIWFNLLLYLGPIAAGAVFVPHFVNAVEGFSSLPERQSFFATFFTTMPDTVGTYVHGVRLTVLVVGLLVGGGFCLEYRKLQRLGYRAPWQKVALFGSTGLCSIIAWGFNPLGVAWAVMNIFHAVQYFALLWCTEGSNMRSGLRLGEGWLPRQLLLFAFLGVFLWGGLLLDQFEDPFTDALLLSCALLHFWYDSFVWSVRKRQHLSVATEG